VNIIIIIINNVLITMTPSQRCHRSITVVIKT